MWELEKVRRPTLPAVTLNPNCPGTQGCLSQPILSSELLASHSIVLWLAAGTSVSADVVLGDDSEAQGLQLESGENVVGGSWSYPFLEEGTEAWALGWEGGGVCCPPCSRADWELPDVIKSFSSSSSFPLYITIITVCFAHPFPGTTPVFKVLQRQKGGFFCDSLRSSWSYVFFFIFFLKCTLSGSSSPDTDVFSPGENCMTMTYRPMRS